MGTININDAKAHLSRLLQRVAAGEEEMDLLLDTHALLWWLGNHLTLSHAARDAIRKPDNDVYVSAATGWEIVIKKALGKLNAPNTFEEALSENGFFELPITIAHAEAAAKLPDIHNDPFDRMPIAQAQPKQLILVSRDRNISQYDVAVLKA